MGVSQSRTLKTLLLIFNWRSRLPDQLVTTVQPLPSKEVFAANPATPGAEDVPPSKLTVPFDWPAVSRETRILSTLSSVRAQYCQAKVKSVATQLSNIPAGKEAKFVQSYHVFKNVVPELKFSAGKAVRLVHSAQVNLKSLPELTSRIGKEVRLMQIFQAL